MLGREEFRKIFEDYKSISEPSDKEHIRETDIAGRSISPQKLYGVPVGLMFFEGARRLLDATATIPGLVMVAPDGVVFEGIREFQIV